MTIPSMSGREMIPLGISASQETNKKGLLRASAAQRIISFLELTPEGVKTGEYLEDTDTTAAIALFRHEELHSNWQPNQYLALSMMGLATALNTLRQLDPPVEAGEKLKSKRTIINGETGKATSYTFNAHLNGLDFGLYLGYSIKGPKRRGPFNISTPRERLGTWANFPTDHYLRNVLTFGDPHEPVFRAWEPDTYSPPWSEIDKEWIDSIEGYADRVFDPDRMIYSDDWEYMADQSKWRKDIFRPGTVTYSPLYNSDAYGLSGYLRVTQDLVKKFLDAVSVRDNNN